MKQTAIFGGTFNPPHNGHVAMVKGILALDDIESVLVMPSKAPPHKSGSIASVEDRVQMCRLAFGDISGARLCLDELSLGGKSYTVNTLEHFRKKGVNRPILVIGGDSLVNFHKWYRYEDILKMAQLYVYYRADVDDRAVLSAKESLESRGGKIRVIDICPPDISSTEIRKILAEKKNADNLIPKKVADYITTKKLYAEG